MVDPGPATVRSFVAVDLPSQVRSGLAQVQSALRAHTRDVRWVAPEGIHLTLEFLDNIPLGSVPRVALALESLPARAPFTLSLDGLGAFPDWRAPRVLWVGLAGDLAALVALREGVAAALHPLGFPSDPRPFTPHLTLGRFRRAGSPSSVQPLARAAQALRAETLPFAVSAVTLFRSTLTPGGAIYSTLAQVSLERPRSDRQ